MLHVLGQQQTTPGLRRHAQHAGIPDLKAMIARQPARALKKATTDVPTSTPDRDPAVEALLDLGGAKAAPCGATRCTVRPEPGPEAPYRAGEAGR